jgi:hypothetical protein
MATCNNTVSSYNDALAQVIMIIATYITLLITASSWMMAQFGETASSEPPCAATQWIALSAHATSLSTAGWQHVLPSYSLTLPSYYLPRISLHLPHHPLSPPPDTLPHAPGYATPRARSSLVPALSSQPICTHTMATTDCLWHPHTGHWLCSRPCWHSRTPALPAEMATMIPCVMIIITQLHTYPWGPMPSLHLWPVGYALASHQRHTLATHTACMRCY